MEGWLSFQYLCKAPVRDCFDLAPVLGGVFVREALRPEARTFDVSSQSCSGGGLD